MGLMAVAGAVSGMGQGLERGLMNFQSAVQQSGLLQERERMEDERQRIMLAAQAEQNALNRQHATESQGKKIAADRAINQENLGGRIVSEAMQQAGANTRTDKSLASEEKRAAMHEAGADRRTDKEIGSRASEGEATRENQRSIATDSNASHERIAAAANKSHEKVAAMTHDTALKDYELARKKLQDSIRDQLVEANKNNDEEKIASLTNQLDAMIGRPSEDRKIDANSISQALRSTVTDIDRLEVQLNNPMTDEPTKERLQRQIDQARAQVDAYHARLQELTGVKKNGPKTFSIIDPMKMKP